MPFDIVSIIIPAYNAGIYIGRALQSAVSQTYSNIEVIVIDDGSTDGTVNVVKSYVDPRIVYARQENKGQGAARNHGIRISKGEYLTFLDADDAYIPLKVERQVTFLETHPEYDVVYCNALHFQGNLNKRKTSRKVAKILKESIAHSFCPEIKR